MNRQPDVSVVIVNYNVKHFLEQCLHSVEAAAKDLLVEVFVVDNNSSDGSLDYITPRFPDVKFIHSRENLGFGRANNLALEQALGRYLLVLNPDTLVAEDTLRVLVRFMDEHPRVGAAGPKILTRDGSYDITSKRGLPTPWVAFCKLSGLAGLFPRSSFFGRYNLLYLDEDTPAEVDAITGSCMMVRREVYGQVGGFDPDYFMYGEDIDWCYRINRAGWGVHYVPLTRIIHFKGESTRRSRIDRDRAFYGAMHLFVDKHFSRGLPVPAHWLISLGIILAEGMSRLGRIWRRIHWPLLDWFGILAVMVAGRWLRWGAVGLKRDVVFSLLVEATVWTASLALLGAYGRRRGELRPLVMGMGLGFLVNSSFTYFFKQFGYSRFVTLFGLTAGGGWVWGWRFSLRVLRRTGAWRRFFQRRALLVGAGDLGVAVAGQMQETAQPIYQLVGFVDPDAEQVGRIVAGLPVLGTADELARIAGQEEIEEVIFALDRLDYDRVLELIARVGGTRSVEFKVVTTDSINHPEGLTPLLSLEYLSPRGMGKSLRKISTIILKK